MRRTCLDCRTTFDDAVSTTICPHERFISDEDAQLKDLAYSLLDKDLHWNHLPDGPSVRIEYINALGMVGLKGWSGEFAPYLFREAV